MPQGEAVRRYGQVIGQATQPIAAGTHVHTHNIGMGDYDHDYAWGVDSRPTARMPTSERSFLGIRRADGRIATRNYIGILTSVNCSAHVAGLGGRRSSAATRSPGPTHYRSFPNVDGVIALTHEGPAAA